MELVTLLTFRNGGFRLKCELFCSALRFWWESPWERDHYGDRSVDGRTRSEWILGRLAGGTKRIVNPVGSG
jgi:hypothetical protein